MLMKSSIKYAENNINNLIKIERVPKTESERIFWSNLGSFFAFNQMQMTNFDLSRWQKKIVQLLLSQGFLHNLNYANNMLVFSISCIKYNQACRMHEIETRYLIVCDILNGEWRLFERKIVEFYVDLGIVSGIVWNWIKFFMSLLRGHLCSTER